MWRVAVIEDVVHGFHDPIGTMVLLQLFVSINVPPMAKQTDELILRVDADQLKAYIRFKKDT